MLMSYEINSVQEQHLLIQGKRVLLINATRGSKRYSFRFELVPNEGRYGFEGEMRIHNAKKTTIRFLVLPTVSNETLSLLDKYQLKYQVLEIVE